MNSVAQTAAIEELQAQVRELRQAMSRVNMALVSEGLLSLKPAGPYPYEDVLSDSLIRHPFNGLPGDDCGVCGYPETHEGHTEYDD